MYPSPYNRLTGFILRSSSFLLIFLSVVLVSSASSRTWYIKPDGTGDAPTIQAGVDSAAAGDTVMVGPGVYSDTTSVPINGQLRAVNVCLRKGIVLLGDPVADRPTIDGANSYIGIYVENSSPIVVIGYVELRRLGSWPILSPVDVGRLSAAASDYPARISCVSSSIVIYDVAVSGDHDGIYLWNSIAEVRNSSFKNLEMAIICLEASDVEIHNNIMTYCHVGVLCEESSTNIHDNAIGAPEPAVQNVGILCNNSSANISGNDIKWCGNGISVTGGTATVEANKLSKNQHGVQQIACSSTISHNLFYHNWYGVWSTSNSTGEITNNTIDTCDVSVYSELGSIQVIRGNIMTRGIWGVQCGLATLTVECNNIFEMRAGLYDWFCAGEQPDGTNFSADPQFCGIDDSGNYYLQSDSPCAPGNHPGSFDCGLLGAFPINCGNVGTEGTTWGSLKARFLNGGE